MERLNWIELTKENLKQIAEEIKENRAMREENRNDKRLLKALNRELRGTHVRLKLWHYESSPFTKKGGDEVIPIILRYAGQCERKINAAALLSALRAPRFEAAERSKKDDNL